MAPKLPNHLASLLRHQPAASPVAASSAAKTSQDGKAARKKAARVKRRAKAKEDRAADRAERVEKKKQLQEVEVKADPPESTIAKKKKKLVPKKKRAAVAKREGEENKAPCRIMNFQSFWFLHAFMSLIFPRFPIKFNKAGFFFLASLVNCQVHISCYLASLVSLRLRSPRAPRPQRPQRPVPLTRQQQTRRCCLIWRRSWALQATASAGARRRNRFLQIFLRPKIWESSSFHHPMRMRQRLAWKL